MDKTGTVSIEKYLYLAQTPTYTVQYIFINIHVNEAYEMSATHQVITIYSKSALCDLKW